MANGSLTVLSASDLEIVHGAVLVANGSGDALVLSAANDFNNNAGSSAVQLNGGGRFLIYSDLPGGDIFGNLNSGHTAVWNAVYGDSITAAGSRYIFAYQPTITVTSTDVSKSFGTDVTATVAAAYTISGLQGGVTNVFLGDSAGAVYSGTPSVTSAGSAANANASGSPYAITVATGSFTTMDGYGLTLASSGQLPSLPHRP